MIVRMIRGQSVEDHSRGLYTLDLAGYYPITACERPGGGVVIVQVMRGKRAMRLTIPESLYLYLPTMDYMPGDDS